MNLVVTEYFDGYFVGVTISDPTLIAAILSDFRQHKVVQVGEPSAFNTLSPQAPEPGAILPISQKPIVGMIGHSYVSRSVNQMEVVSVARSGGVATLVTLWPLGLSVGYLMRVTGCGAPYDGDVFALTGVTEVTSGTGTYTYAISDTSTASATTPFDGISIDLGSGGATGGYLSASWLSRAAEFMQDAFYLSPRYMAGVNGGGFVPVFVGDPGFLKQCQRIVARKNADGLARLTLVVDNGVNDYNHGTSVDDVFASIYTGVDLLHANNIDVIFEAIRPYPGGDATKSAKIWQHNSKLIREASAKGWAVSNSYRRLADPASAIGGARSAIIDHSDSANVHTNGLGVLNDAAQFSIDMGWKFPVPGDKQWSQSMAFGANNPHGNIFGTSGIFTASAGSVTLNNSANSGFGPAIGGVLVACSDSTATAVVSQRANSGLLADTDPGFELVITIPAGTGNRYVSIALANGTTAYITPSSSTYSAGDLLRMIAEWKVDALTGGPLHGGSQLALAELAASFSYTYNYMNGIDSSNYARFPNLAGGGGGISGGAVHKTKTGSNLVRGQFNFWISGTQSVATILRIRGLGVFKTNLPY